MAERRSVTTVGWWLTIPQKTHPAPAGRRTTTATTTATRAAGDVDPGPSGRGKPTVDPAPPRFPVLSPRWILFVVVALAFNVWLVSYLPDPPQRRVRFPTTPPSSSRYATGT